LAIIAVADLRGVSTALTTAFGAGRICDHGERVLTTVEK
jgi:hypothetical protein